jgi:hypothetical protein
MKTEWVDNRPKPRVQKRVYPFKLNRMPKSADEQNKMADELVEWAFQPESILMEEFPISKMISPYRFFHLADEKSNQYFTDAYEFANSMCAIKMQKGKHTLDINLMNKIFPLYHKRYAEYLVARELRAVESGKSSSTIVVQMEPSKSDIVPLCVSE